MRRFLAVLLALLAIASPVAFATGYRLPTATWFYYLDGQGLKTLAELLNWQGGEVRLGWFSGALGSLAMLWLAWRLWTGKLLAATPVTLRRIRCFRAIRRGLVSFWIVLALVVLAMLDMVVVGQRALLVRTEKGMFFPAFRHAPMLAEDFDLEGQVPVDYRLLEEQLEARECDAFVLMPPVPWEPTLDSDGQLKQPLVLAGDGLLRRDSGQLFSGVAIAYWNGTEPEEEGKEPRRARQLRVRDGRFEGVEERYDRRGELLGFVRWEAGDLVGVGAGIDPEAEIPEEFTETLFNPVPPHAGRRHWLGTDSRGWDVAAQLFGGWQVILRGLVLYLMAVYGLGILIGTAMGYFGGVFDIVLHRLTEIVSAVPLLLLIMILGAQLGPERMGMMVLIGLFCLFRWVGVAMYLRSLTYREKARDYVAAARSLGAGTARILLRHIVPNTVALIVTLVPFEVVFFSGFLTALDFVGYGLPPDYPSWGRLLSDGLDQLTSPWIVSSVFAVLVLVLLLFTFVGEAVREAFDPKKFSTYR